MMTVIGAPCTGCGDEVQVTADDIALFVTDAGRGLYSFTCPECGCRVTRPAPDKVVTLLMSAGVKVRVFDLPPRCDDPPLTDDDLIAFGRLVEAGSALSTVALEESAGLVRSRLSGVPRDS